MKDLFHTRVNILFKNVAHKILQMQDWLLSVSPTQSQFQLHLWHIHLYSL